MGHDLKYMFTLYKNYHIDPSPSVALRKVASVNLALVGDIQAAKQAMRDHRFWLPRLEKRQSQSMAQRLQEQLLMQH